MSKQEKIELIKYSIARFDHYFDSVNNKANLYLTLNTFLFGGLITGYYSIKDDLIINCFPQYLIIILLVCILAGLLLTLAAINPYLNTKKPKRSSILYFGDMAKISLSSLHNTYSSLDEQNLYKDFVKQQHVLSVGLCKKFNLLRYVTYALAIDFITISIIGIYIFKNI